MTALLDSGAMVMTPVWHSMDTAPNDRRVLVYSPKYGEIFVAFLGTNPEDGEQKWVIARGENVTFIVPDPSHWAELPTSPDHSGDANEMVSELRKALEKTRSALVCVNGHWATDSPCWHQAISSLSFMEGVGFYAQPNTYFRIDHAAAIAEIDRVLGEEK